MGLENVLREARELLEEGVIPKVETSIKKPPASDDDPPPETTTDQKTKLQSYNEGSKQAIVRMEAIRIGATSQAIDKIIEGGTKEDADEMFETLQKRFKGAFAKPTSETESFRLYEIDVPSTEGGFIKYQVKEPTDGNQPVEFIKGKAVQ